MMIGSFFLSSCGRFVYGVDILNYGDSGILLLKIGDMEATGLHQAFSELGVSVPIIAGRFPSIPSKYRDPASYFGRFNERHATLPDDVVIGWQLADLKNCKAERRVSADSLAQRSIKSASVYAAKEYVFKDDCSWHPRPDKVYQQKLDLRPIKNSDAYKRTGDRYKDVAGSRYTLNITLIFIEDQVKVEVDNGATNPWL
ncbi:hypothetical protein DFR24_1944 [Panacagrimonas perspica]|uniref:Uncharacterized protein n=2 Tax=Panacagrimonas perspica TaxID=381431 RepID=A0A4S3KB79_9GAMM|nr:hypothetical protein DFR24_1944 [Panacagrimonas perspica]THD05448.1 hypothetical protein B1810_01600 [Panacagrimonas perspica]